MERIRERMAQEVSGYVSISPCQLDCSAKDKDLIERRLIFHWLKNERSGKGFSRIPLGPGSLRGVRSCDM